MTLLVISTMLNATIIVPFENLGEVFKAADLVVYGKITYQGFKAMNSDSLEYFEIQPEVRFKQNQTANNPINIRTYHRFSKGLETLVWGDISLRENQSYLLFLKESNIPGMYIPLCLSYYSFEETKSNGVSYLVPTKESEYLTLVNRPDGKRVEPLIPYRKNDLLDILTQLDQEKGTWKDLTKEVHPILNNIQSIIQARAEPPGHCTFLFQNEPWSRWTGFPNSPLPVRYRSGGDASCSSAIDFVTAAVSALNSEYLGINLSNAGAFTGYTPDCVGGSAGGGNFTTYVGSNLGGSRNDCVIFNDPCGEIDDLVGCAGVLAIGGHYGFTPYHNFQGKNWYTAGYGYLIVNNNTGSCYCSAAVYQIMLEHELTHTLGIGHIDDSYGVANMNPSCCNAITQLDKDCLEYTYPFALPIELQSFSGKLREANIDLIWETSLELNNKEFQIEQGSDGERFVAVQTVEALNGNSQNSKIYTSSISALPGINYVRLAQIDLDGAKYYVGNILSFNNLSQDISAYYLSHNIHLSIPNVLKYSDLELQLIDAQGRMVRSLNSTSSNLIDVSSISPGLYILVVNGKSILKFAKTN